MGRKVWKRSPKRCIILCYSLVGNPGTIHIRYMYSYTILAVLLCCHGPSGTTSVDNLYPAPWECSHPVHGSEPHSSPLDPSVPYEVVLQQGQFSSSHSLAWPQVSLIEAQPWSQFISIPREVAHGLDSWLNLTAVSGSVPLHCRRTVVLGPCNQVGIAPKLAMST